jgi:hypothetical protein
VGWVWRRKRSHAHARGTSEPRCTDAQRPCERSGGGTAGLGLGAKANTPPPVKAAGPRRLEEPARNTQPTHHAPAARCCDKAGGQVAVVVGGCGCVLTRGTTGTAPPPTTPGEGSGGRRHRPRGGQRAGTTCCATSRSCSSSSGGAWGAHHRPTGPLATGARADGVGWQVHQERSGRGGREASRGTATAATPPTTGTPAASGRRRQRAAGGAGSVCNHNSSRTPAGNDVAGGQVGEGRWGSRPPTPTTPATPDTPHTPTVAPSGVTTHAPQHGHGRAHGEEPRGHNSGV